MCIRDSYEYCFNNGIHVLATSPVFAQPVAEMALGLTLSIARSIHIAHSDFVVSKEKYGGAISQKNFLLKNKTFGLIGFGDLAKSLTPLLKVFSKDILAYDPWVPNKEIERLDVGKLTFDKAKEMFGDDFPQFPKDQLPSVKNIFDMMEEVEGLETAIANLNVPVLLWVGEKEPVLFRKGKSLAKQHGWDFFSVEGDHIGGFTNTVSVLPQLMQFLSKTSHN